MPASADQVEVSGTVFADVGVKAHGSGPPRYPLGPSSTGDYQNSSPRTARQMAIFGYARVSTRDQHLTGQIEALTAAGATTIFKEKISGVRADRPQLAKLMASLKAGEVVLVTKLDRLGRSTRELLDLIERIGKAGAAFRSLGAPLLHTPSSQGRLLSTLLAAIAEFERELIRERTGEGRKRAMAK